VLHAARWKCRTQKLSKIRRLGATAQIYRTISSQLRYVSTIGKMLNSNMSPTCPHNMANFDRLTAEICSRVWARQQISTGFASWLRYYSDVAHRRPAKLWTTFDVLLGCYTIYTFSGALAPDRILPGAKFTLHPSLAFSYIGGVTARQSSSGCQPKFAAWYKEWNYRTFAEGATYIRQGAITLGIEQHSSFNLFCVNMYAYQCGRGE